MRVLSLFLLLSLFQFFCPLRASADTAETVPLPSQESGNYSKAEKLLPGEEVVTPTGQKFKVWSTQGPVEVSKAPEPFEDAETNDEEVHIVIDGAQLRKQNQIGNPPAIAPRK